MTLHSLGRIPSPPDARDWKLTNFLASDGSLRDQAVAELKQTTVGYVNSYWKTPPGNTHWAKALALLAQIPGSAPVVVDKVWADVETILDQLDYGTCVGNGWAQWGNTLPVDDKFNETVARAIYYEATVIDGAPDDPDAPGGGQQGATVRAGAKAMQNRGRLNAYAFASTTAEMSLWLQSHGPLVVGVDWYNQMFNPDSQGFVYPTGGVAGGHCVVCVGDVPSKSAFEFINSWGPGWGLQGHFFMKYTDFGKLLSTGGEAITALEL